MKQSEQLEKEKSIFLSLCCQSDRDMLTGKADMTLQDFERITYLTMVFGFAKYTLTLHEEYLDFANILSGRLDREHEILKEYTTYYLDEQVDKIYQKWIDDFLNQLSTDKRNYYREQLKNNA